MRLWSLNPKYLDARGLTACWREGLLARKVLAGETRGYTRHPQLERFRAAEDPILFIDTYLKGVFAEAASRGYRFDATKLGGKTSSRTLNVTDGQLRYEFEWLKSKLVVRDPESFASIANVPSPAAHPLFQVVPGPIEAWERMG